MGNHKNLDELKWRNNNLPAYFCGVKGILADQLLLLICIIETDEARGLVGGGTIIRASRNNWHFTIQKIF